MKPRTYTFILALVAALVWLLIGVIAFAQTSGGSLYPGAQTTTSRNLMTLAPPSALSILRINTDGSNSYIDSAGLANWLGVTTDGALNAFAADPASNGNFSPSQWKLRMSLDQVSNFPVATQAQANAGAASTMLTADTGREAMNLPYSYKLNSIGTTYKAEDLTWTAGRTVTWFGFLDEALITEDYQWQNAYAGTSTTPLNLDNITDVETTSGGVVISSEGSAGTVSVTTSNAGYWDFTIGPSHFKMPFFGIEAILSSFPAKGTTSNIVDLGVEIVPKNTSLQYLCVRFNKLTNGIGIFKRNGGSETQTAGAAIGTVPYAIGFSISDKVVTAWVQLTSTSGWQYVCHSEIDPLADGINLRSATTLASLKPFIGGYFDGLTGTDALKLGRVRTGYLHGIGIANMEICHNTDGTPWFDGQEVYFMANRTYPTGAQGISDSQACLMAYNVFSGGLRTVASFAFNRSGSINGDNSGRLVYDSKDKLFILLEGNWSDYGWTPAVPIVTNCYTFDSLPQGAVVASGGVALNLPTSNSYYDPDIRRNGSGNYEVSVTETNAATSWSNTEPMIAQCSSLTGTYTLIGRPSGLTGSHEGCSYAWVGGTCRLIVSGYYGANDYAVINPDTATTISASKAFGWTQYGVVTHIGLFPISNANGVAGTSYLSIEHNTSRWSGQWDYGGTWSHGQLRTAWASQVNTGHEFEIKRLPWK